MGHPLHPPRRGRDRRAPGRDQRQHQRRGPGRPDRWRRPEHPVGSIHDRVAAIDRGVTAILDAARAIRSSYDGPDNGSGVAGINHRVGEIITLAQGIHGDLAAVFGIVSPVGGPGPGANLYGHVKSIDDQSLVTILGQLHLPSKG